MNTHSANRLFLMAFMALIPYTPIALSMTIDLANMDHYFPPLAYGSLADALTLATTHLTIANTILQESEFDHNLLHISTATAEAITDVVRQKLIEDRDYFSSRLQRLDASHQSYSAIKGIIEMLDESIAPLSSITHGPILDDGPER